MHKVLIGFVAALGAVALGTAGAAVASPTVRMTIIHAVQGCHVWGNVNGQPFGAARTLKVKHGTRVSIRVNCAMSFELTQIAGPTLTLGDPLMQPGTVRTIAFAKRGVYRLQARNVETSADMGLQTLGPDNTLVLVVRVS